jgi:hypothetical protein
LMGSAGAALVASIVSLCGILNYVESTMIW